MLPCSSINNRVYRGEVEAIFFGKALSVLAALSQLSNNINIFFSYFCDCSRRLWTIISSLLNHISNVIGMGSKKQVFWVYTFRIIAFVKNMKASGDWPNIYHPRNPMRRKGFAAISPGSYFPIPFSVETSSPKPTACRFGNLWPKSLRNGLWFRPLAFFHRGYLSKYSLCFTENNRRYEAENG